MFGNGVGVIGVSEGAEGVRGESADGDAVVGRSSAGRGGRFQSGVSAGGSIVGQVGLVPQRMPLPRRVPVSPSIYDLRVREVLPPEGRGGDLLVTEGEDGTCALWFCTNSAEPERRAVWREVLLGPTSLGPPELVDWREAVEDQGALGIWRGGAVRLRGPLGTGHALAGEFPGFSTADFTPPMAATDAIELVGATGHQFQIDFEVPIQDPVLHLASLGSEIVFAGGVEPVVLSGQDVTADGSTLTGNLNPDADCSVRLDGRFAAIGFAATAWRRRRLTASSSRSADSPADRRRLPSPARAIGRPASVSCGGAGDRQRAGETSHGWCRSRYVTLSIIIMSSCMPCATSGGGMLSRCRASASDVK